LTIVPSRSSSASAPAPRKTHKHLSAGLDVLLCGH
jgi:hypothetical protein